MEALAPFGVIGFIFALIVWSQNSKLSARLKKIEEYLQEEGYVDQEKESLKEILQKNIGRAVKLEQDEESLDFDVNNKPCVILDMDEVWLRIRMEKKQEEYLIRIAGVKGVQFIET